MIRQALKSDLPAIKKLIDDAAKIHHILPRSINEIKEVIEYFFVSEENDKVVGCCALEIYNKKIAEIRSLVVEKEYREKGIGKKLISACLKKAKENNIYEVLSITDKINFFKKCGFDTCLNDQYAMFIHP